MSIKYDELDDFTKGYIACAIWSSTWPDSGLPLDADFSPADLSQLALASIVKDCAAFQKDNMGLLMRASGDLSRHGLDFWLTRNRHGAGFWDHDYGPIGEELTAAAQVFGESNIYPSDAVELEVS